MLRKSSGIKSRAIPSIPTHADGKEYIVSLKPGVDYDAFWTEIEQDSNGDGHVPSRPVRFVNERPLSKRSCHYVLTDAEADILRKDNRVDSVVIPAQHLGFQPKPNAVRSGNFDKPTDDFSSNGNFLNYGLVRHNSLINNYSTDRSYSVAEGPLGYTYTLDGTGVDVVIMDTGIQVDHPEFTDAEGNSRVQLVDWYDVSGLSGSMPGSHYQDTQGHGTHVTGIAAGKTYGWAKNAAIYSVKLAGLEGEEGGALPYWDAFDVIIGWHQNKPVDPATGYKRPTIVNMSWGFGGDYFIDENTTIVTGGSYRGQTWIGSRAPEDVHAEYGMGEFGTFTVRDPATDSIIEEMIDAGIHICIAAGNDGVKIDLPSGADYNNYFVDNSFPVPQHIFYNRGSSPYSTRAINVGCLDLNAYNVNADQKADFSEGGPGVDFYACGYAIYSATSNANTFAAEGYSDAPYYANEGFRQGCISGTSMAAPQVCGLGALVLQINPASKPVEFKNFMMYQTGGALHHTNLDNDYTVGNSLWGGSRAILYNKFNSYTSLTIKTT